MNLENQLLIYLDEHMRQNVFDDEDTDDPKIKDSVLRMITKQFQEFETEYPILKYSLIGSILTKEIS